MVAPTFHVVSGSAVKSTIDDNRKQVFDVVEAAYRLHSAGGTVNPDSYFLRYPDNPNARIIALPAHLGGDFQTSGIKWISSFPENRASNLARASAVLILNDANTGYPLACLEASLISATRTAASAALAAEHMSPEPFAGTLGVIGTGVIARTTVEWLLFRNWKFRKINLYDADPKEAERFTRWLRDQHNLQAEIKGRLEDAICDASLVLFTTTTLEPYLADEKLLEHCPTILHLSLRDICENVILASQNVVDDVEHCLKARTSLHLAEMATGSRSLSWERWWMSWKRRSRRIVRGPGFSPRSGLAFSILPWEVLSSRRRSRPTPRLRCRTSSAIPYDGEPAVGLSSHSGRRA